MALGVAVLVASLVNDSEAPAMADTAAKVSAGNPKALVSGAYVLLLSPYAVPVVVKTGGKTNVTGGASSTSPRVATS